MKFALTKKCAKKIEWSVFRKSGLLSVNFSPYAKYVNVMDGL